MDLPKDFNWIIYLELNEDLKNKISDKHKAEKHFLNHGLRENRKYLVEIPPDFDWKIYLELNKNLKEKISTEENAKNHYRKFGFKEKRNYKVVIPPNFDWIAYLYINPDVKNHSFDTEEKAKFHYLTYGFFENRSYCWSFSSFSSFNKEESLLEKYSGNKDNYIIKLQSITDKINITDLSNAKNYSCIEYKNIKNLFENQLDYCKNKLDELYIDTFILIIDFPNYGGGAQQFLNSIISHFKLKNNFLIIRNNIDNQIEVSINNNYVLNKKMDVSSILSFIDSNKNKISKIFINHILNHSFEFLDKLFELGKETTTITHDYFFICLQAQPYYNQIPNYFRKSSYISKCNTIITQNKNNLIHFYPFLSNNQKIILTPLPDFQKSVFKITTDNTKIVIGIIGAISKPKGSQLVKQLIHYFEQNESVEIIIFGKLDFQYSNCYLYKDIYELNNLLIKHKPNVLLETSLWPETYSFTLTLAMLTQLPILSLKKNFNSVIEDRLSYYPKHYFYNNIEELEKLVFTWKQNYFYTIDSIFYFNSFWNDYFSGSCFEQELLFLQQSNDLNFKNVFNKNIVFITSKIYVSDQVFTYTDKRSIYSVEERFLQTIETIKSIRNLIPDSYIVLLDNSIFSLYEKCVFYKLCDCFINKVDNDTLNYFTNENKIKAYADISQQVAFLDLFIPKVDLSTIQHFFKISGRYVINKEFNFNKYNNDKNLFKQNVNVPKKDYFYTCFYKLDKNMLKDYHQKLGLLLNVKKDELLDIDCEILLPSLFLDKITEVNDSLGITQRVAVWEDLSNI